MKIIGPQFLYGVLAFIGVIVTWYFNLQPMETSYIAGLYTNPAASFFTNDLIVVTAAFLVWSFVETKRLKCLMVCGQQFSFLPWLLPPR